MVLYVVTTAVFAAVVMLLHRLLLPMATGRRVPSHIARRRALFHPLLHRTQLLRLFLMLVPVLGLLRDRHVVLMMLCHATLAPTLRRMFHEGTGVVDFRDRKYWPLIRPRNKGDQLKDCSVRTVQQISFTRPTCRIAELSTIRGLPQSPASLSNGCCMAACCGGNCCHDGTIAAIWRLPPGQEVCTAFCGQTTGLLYDTWERYRA